ADGAILTGGQGRGLKVNADDIEVGYEQRDPAAVGPNSSPGSSDTTARGDHTHRLPLALSGGLEFTANGGAPQLRINGPVRGETIDFQRPVSGQDPVDPRHLATKQYVDNAVGGLSWQSPVLDKDLTVPPDKPQRGDRYLIFTGAPEDAWKGYSGNIATWGTRRWDFIAPTEGMAVFVADENLAYLFVDGKWIQFLAPPAAVGAGDGLILKGSDLAVGQGDGVVVSADAVSVSFGADAPPPVGTTATAGKSRQAAQNDHTHALPLANQSGLEFRATRPGNAPRLRINGQVAGAAIDFQAPVLGQTPTDARHIATKQYVDENRLNVVAGAGLVGKDNVISVGG